MQQLDLFAELFPALLEQLERAANVRRRLEHRTIVQRGHLLIAAPGAVSGHAGHADLHSDVTKARIHKASRAVDRLLELVTLRVAVAVRRLAALAAEQLIHGQTGLPAL